MFNNIPQWGWVIIAWVQLLIAYGGYMLYLNWRQKRLNEEE